MTVNIRDDFATSCRELVVPADACRIRFSPAPGVNAEHVGYTSRGEMVVLHYDAAGDITYIELVGDGKPCQSPVVLN